MTGTLSTQTPGQPAPTPTPRPALPWWQRRSSPRSPQRPGSQPRRPEDAARRAADAARRAEDDALRWLGRHWLPTAAMAFVVVRLVQRLRAAREEGPTQGTDAGWLGSPPPPAALQGIGPLERAASLRAEAERRPGDGGVRLALGKALLESGRAHEAVRVLRQAAEDERAEAGHHLELGRALSQACLWDDALAALAAAARLAPDDPEVHELRGEVLAEKHWSGQDTLAPDAAAAFREAIRLHARRLEADPDDAKARTRRGSLLVGLGELEAGLAELRKAAAERPADPEAQTALAAALAEADLHDESARRYAAAAEAQRSLASRNPDHAGHHDRLGELLNEAGLDGDVDAWYEAALIDPDYPDVEIKLLEQGGDVEARFFDGVRHLKAGEWEKAVSELRAVIDEIPVHAPAFYALGVGLARQDRTVEAERALRNALRLRPDWPRARQALESLRGSRA